ncbi:E1-like protein-activating enzyme Gsa7p/Apg7p [Sporodiniella umbellata]|nr:E1-like protein-activating enzyme Gsa7p/Apg7p [Sporodiniella umbellata]
MDILKFSPVQSSIDGSFWQRLAQKKLDDYKLEQGPIAIYGYYPKTKRQAMNTAGEKVMLPSHLTLPDDAFEPKNGEGIPGTLINTNTIEEFRQLDKQPWFREATEKIEHGIHSGQTIKAPDELNRFLLITFADLKKYKFYYWFGFPAIVPQSPWRFKARVVFSAEKHAQLEAAYQAWSRKDGFFLVDAENGCHALSDYDPEKSYRFGFLDPSSHPDTLGWPARNFLYLIYQQWGLSDVCLIAYRPQQTFCIDCQLDSVYTPRKSLGWERNDQGKLGPRMADLAALMDPVCLSDSAIDLNLKLMKWRLLPQLDLDRIQQTKCLLLGAGTLGCYVARCLVGWGVREITFVDNGQVSFSNPVRQPLYQFKDIGGLKAKVAAAHLKEIQPTMKSEGYTFSIPMPGHDHYRTLAALEKERESLETLIRTHDAVFLLTDSRESRWLPTLLGAKHGKWVMNSALGFDSFLVMRHGTVKNGLGCYFCNDVVAPVDSLTDRTLDQQCTVTRPGLALLASALTVELMVSLSQHPEGSHAPADTAHTEVGGSLLGLLPHQIRGFLGGFKQLLISGQAFDKCIACSAKVLAAYEQDPTGFLKRVLENPLILEDITGIKALKEESDALLEDWLSEEEE